ncbi:MAG TPA: OmpA family protein [Candidatus Omnitrophota bacterium]|nr:OmpA family protein [Candidatus Omnitrophota bacterium]
MRTLKALLAAGAIAVLPAAAHAQWYIGADAGVNFTEDSSGSGNGRSYKGEYEWGYVGLGQVGYNFGGPKAEFEVGYRTNDHDNINNISANGDTSSWSFMANGIYEFLPQSKFHPFLGAGIGYANVDTNGTSAGVAYSGDEWVFAYQGLAGVAYDVADNVAIKAQYRYFATLDYDIRATNGLRGEADYNNHSVLVGLTYKFAKPAPVVAAAPAPTPVAPAPTPAPKAAPVQKNYMVFFDFNKADITPEASKIIGQAVTTAKAGNATRVDLTGHADRSGSDKYNMALSLKRANAVKAAMVKQGVPADQISVVAKGESAPLVPTADGVREPQNRRVEIVLP